MIICTMSIDNRPLANEIGVMKNNAPPLQGLIAAPFTPLRNDGSLNTGAIPHIVDHLVEHDIAGM